MIDKLIVEIKWNNKKCSVNLRAETEQKKQRIEKLVR